MNAWRSHLIHLLSQQSPVGGIVLLVAGAVVLAGLIDLGLGLLPAPVEHGRLENLPLALGIAVVVATPIACLLVGVARQLEGSKRRLAEEIDLSRQAEQRFRDYAECSSDWFWETDEQHRFIYFSERHDQIVGAPAASRLGVRRVDLRRDDPVSDDWDAHLDDLAHRRPFRSFRYGTIDASGRRRVIRVSGKPVFDPEGRFCGYRGVGDEITHQYEQERALRDREQRLSKAQQVAHLGDWRWEVGTGKLAWSAETYRIFGVDPATFPLTFEAFADLVHPDDRPRSRHATRPRWPRAGTRSTRCASPGPTARCAVCGRNPYRRRTSAVR